MECVDRHKLWLSSNGEEGQRLVLADLSLQDRSDFTNRNWDGYDLTDADLSGMVAESITMRHCNLTRCVMNNVQLKDCRMMFCNLFQVSMVSGTVSGGHFEFVNFSQSIVENVRFEHCYFSSCNMFEVLFSQCEVRLAAFYRVNMIKTQWNYSKLELVTMRWVSAYSSIFFCTEMPDLEALDSGFSVSIFQDCTMPRSMKDGYAEGTSFINCECVGLDLSGTTADQSLVAYCDMSDAVIDSDKINGLRFYNSFMPKSLEDFCE